MGEELKRLKEKQAKRKEIRAEQEKKCKKKNYTTPKKIEHKHKKVKLAVLKYYKVDDNGKIHRLRRECPAEECGAGIFMAAHFDRQYCGKCGLTYVYNPIEEK